MSEGGWAGAVHAAFTQPGEHWCHNPPAFERAHSVAPLVSSGPGAATPTMNMPSTALLNIAPQNSSSLTLSGLNGYSIHGDRVIISASEISNHRHADNLSGSLSLELWALDRPYFGGDFDGVALAGVQIGRVQGQHLLVNNQYDLPFTAPGAGTWTLTLMLREWEGQGFVTRDQVQFAQPYVVERKAAAAVQAQADNVITVNFAAAEPRAEGAAQAVAVPEPEPKAAAKAPAAAPADRRLSLNTASRAEIAAIKGVSKKLAEAIVAARPFASMADLLAVKGMGPKLLEKIRTLVRL